MGSSPPLDCRAASSRVPGEEDPLDVPNERPERRVIARTTAIACALAARGAAAPAALQPVRRRPHAVPPEARRDRLHRRHHGQPHDPIEGVDVILTKPDGITETVTTGEDGKFSFEVTEPGRLPRRRRPRHPAQGFRAAAAGRGRPARPDGALKVDSVSWAVLRRDADRARRRLRATPRASGTSSSSPASTASASACCWPWPASASSLIYGTTGISNFAHAEQVTLGGMLGYFLVNVHGLNLWLGWAARGHRCAASAAGSRTASCGSRCDDAGWA